MKEGGRKDSGSPVIASRSEAIQLFLSGLPRAEAPRNDSQSPKINTEVYSALH
jgi:V8-like Glu-specific endopeptidase